MTHEERIIIASVWNDMVLRKKLEDNPYSLTQDELGSLENNDRLNAMLDDATHEVQAQTSTA
jgi:ribosome assembly protein YihI (activator of Der GTPase)